LQRADLLRTKTKDSLETTTWRNFAETYRTIYSYINSDLRKYGLTPPQYSVMRSIGVSESRCLTMSDIGKQMVVTFANITTIVDNLEKLGYARRVRDSLDRRCIKVELTPAGLRMFKRIRKSHGMEIAKLMKVLNQQELENLIQYTCKLKRRVTS